MAARPRTKRAPVPVDEPAITSAPPLSARPKSLVFISHDSRDADLAEAFATMLASVSAGTLKSFRSSDKKGGSGIGFGEEWYTAIMSRLAEATDVVALLTPQSVDRPWILYEAGVAKGKLDTTVLGIALGVPLDKVSTGPFGQFQNCGDDEDSMTGLVLQLLSRNPDAAPLEEAVRMQVRIFKGKLEALLAEKGQGLVKTSAPEDDQSAAKLFEEVKAMVRELPDRVEGRVRSITKRGSLRKSHFNPGMLDDLLSSFREEEDQIASWLILISFYREDFPWLYEAGMDVHRALQNAPRGNLIRTARAFTRLAEFTSRSSYIREYISEDKETYFLIRHLPEIAQRFLNDVIERRKMNVILK